MKYSEKNAPSIVIRKGVRQGCVDGEIKVNDIVINNNRYADGQEELQRMMDKLLEQSRKFGLSINAS